MSGDDVLTEEAPAESSTFRWSSLFSWGFFAALGLLVWELTDQSGLAICVACTKFGWDNLATAAWLYDHDPVRPRARACSLFFAANGFRNIGLVAFLVTYSGSKLMALADWWQGKPQVLPVAINWASVNISIAAFCGIFIWLFLGGIAALVAWRSRVAVWVNSSLHQFRKQNHWPPIPYGRNQVRLTAILGIAAQANFWLFLAASAFDWNQPRIYAVSVPFSAWIGWRMTTSISARTPEECWRRGPRTKLTVETVYSDGAAP